MTTEEIARRMGDAIRAFEIAYTCDDTAYDDSKKAYEDLIAFRDELIQDLEARETDMDPIKELEQRVAEADSAQEVYNHAVIYLAKKNKAVEGAQAAVSAACFKVLKGHKTNNQCEDCSSLEGVEGFCPQASEINGVDIPVVLCADCYYYRCDDI
jgi:hypothetical protein